MKAVSGLETAFVVNGRRGKLDADHYVYYDISYSEIDSRILIAKRMEPQGYDIIKTIIISVKHIRIITINHLL